MASTFCPVNKRVTLPAQFVCPSVYLSLGNAAFLVPAVTIKSNLNENKSEGLEREALERDRLGRT